MSQPDLGTMLYFLVGGSANSADKYYGRKIAGAEINENFLRLCFTDGQNIWIWDDGQSCCESRYITCDDNVKDLIGGTLIGIEAKKVSNITDEYKEYDEVHEQVFIEIKTDKGFITFTTHNEHNGCYGGFVLTITEKPPTT